MEISRRNEESETRRLLLAMLMIDDKQDKHKVTSRFSSKKNRYIEAFFFPHQIWCHNSVYIF
jgi:hypothetical protein